MKSYTFWLKAAAVLQLITAAIHSISFFVEPQATNDTERQIFNLVQGYTFDLGGGIQRSLGDLMTGLSMCFTLLYLLASVMLFYMLRSRVDAAVIRGITNLYLLVFGFAFAWMVIFTFLPPIVLTGLVFVLLLIARSIGFRRPAESE